jgi:uncharacterized protein YggL (DUF469 family)
MPDNSPDDAPYHCPLDGIIYPEDSDTGFCSDDNVEEKCNQDVYNKCFQDYIDQVGNCDKWSLGGRNCFDWIDDVQKECRKRACPSK